MRNFKKVIALALAMVMVLSTMTVAFASDKTRDEKATALHELGLFNGVSAKEFVPALEQTSDAAQALTLIGRALKWEVQADATTKFTDVPKWAVPYVAYAVDKGITNGVSETKFGVEVLSGKRLVTWLLAALGQDKAAVWADTETFAKDAGIVVPTGKTRGDVVDVIFAGLTQTPVGGTKTLIQTIVGDDAALKAIAVNAGLMAAKPDKVDFTVEAKNLREVKVMFNMPMDEKTIVKENFTLKKGTASVSIDSATLADDKMTVTLIPTSGNLENQKGYNLTVVNVKDVDGMKIEKTKKEFQTLDVELPKLTDVRFTGPKNLELTFSEPIKAGGKVTIKSGNSTIGVNNSYTYGSNKISVTLYSELKDGTTYTIGTSEFKDYADYVMINDSRDLEYVKNTDGVTATVTKATQKYVVVEFNKPVKGLGIKNFYHTFSAWTAMNIYKEEAMTTTVSTTDSVSKVYVKFANTTSDHPLNPGTTNVVILGKEGSREVKDNWGNVFAGATIAVTVAADTEAPVVSDLTVSAENELKVVFNEQVTFTSSNVKVYDDKGKTISATVSATTGSDAGKAFMIKLGSKYAGKTLKVKITDVKDKSLQENKLVSYEQDITITDKTAPKISNAYYKADDKLLYVLFDEAVTDSALNVKNYYLANTDNTEIHGLTEDVEFFNGDKAVRIALTDQQKTWVTSGTYKLIVRDVADLAGNAMVGESKVLANVTGSASSISEIRAIAKDKIQVLFDQFLPTVQMSAFTVKTNTKTTNPLSMEVATEDGKTLVTLTLDAKGTVDNPYITAATPTVTVSTAPGTTADPKLANSFGVLANTENDSSAGGVKDKIAPSIVANDYVNQGITSGNIGDITGIVTGATGELIDKIVVTFDEPIKAGTIAQNQVTVEGYDVQSIVALSDKLTINVKSAVSGVTYDLNNTPKVSIAAGATDAEGNKFEAVSDKSSIRGVGLAASTIASAVYDKSDDTLTITGTGFEGTFDPTKVTYKADGANTKQLTGGTVTINSRTELVIKLLTADATAIENLSDFGITDSAADVIDVAADYLTLKLTGPVAGTDKEVTFPASGTLKSDAAVTVQD